jgi:hypothetical protein
MTQESSLNLVFTGSTGLEPVTDFYWETGKQATVELTEIGSNQYLIRASKSYRLVKQDAEGQESWDRNLVDMNEYLAQKFSSFNLSVNYTDTVSTQVLDEKEEAGELVKEANHLKHKSRELSEERETLAVSVENSVESLEQVMQKRFEETDQELQQVQKRLDHIMQILEEKKQAVNQWQENGVSLSYLFTFSTDPEIIHKDRVTETIERHVDEAFDLHRRQVKQVLQGPKFKLHVEELDEPRVFNRIQHTGLLNPEGFKQLTDQADHELTQELEELRDKNAEQYMAVALDDITVNDSTIKRSKATPSRAVNSVLQDLEAERVAYAEDTPEDGPIIGTQIGTNQIIGFDPAELPHYYIMGATGSGKSYLKRVLVENVASLGYDVLTISPSDTEEIGLSLPNPENSESTALNVDQYWPGNNKLLDKPESVDELFTGLNALTLTGLNQSEKQEYVNKIFSRLAEIDRSSKPLFVVLEEAHNFNQGEAADSLQKLVREARKFGIHVVIVSQNPTDFSHNHRHVRENTVSLFLRGEYTDYASTFLDDADAITDLEDGQAIIQSPDYSKLEVQVRNTVTKPTAPTEKELEKIDQRFQKQVPELEDTDLVETTEREDKSTKELTEDEEQLVEYIKDYISENDERPSKSKCYRPSKAPFGSSKTSRVLEQLMEKNVLQVETVERYGNESQVYSTA